MAVYKRGDIWWYKFMWRGEYIRESTKQGNRRVAEQIEAAHKTQLAKGEVGLRERTVVPTLGVFAEQIFIPAIETERRGKPKAVKSYKERVARMKTFSRLWDARLDRITPDDITAYVSARQVLGIDDQSRSSNSPAYVQCRD